jgi:hypothetical protein
MHSDDRRPAQSPCPAFSSLEPGIYGARKVRVDPSWPGQAGLHSAIYTLAADRISFAGGVDHRIEPGDDDLPLNGKQFRTQSAEPVSRGTTPAITTMRADRFSLSTSLFRPEEPLMSGIVDDRSVIPLSLFSGPGV